MFQRASWVDYAKAIGICLVVYGHVARGLMSAGLVRDETLMRLLDAVIYSFHMQLFFFLSGVFLFDSLKKAGASGYALSKLDTVLYPFVLWSLLQGGLEVILSAYTNGNATVEQVLSLWWAPRAQFWFLYALFFCTLLAALVVGLMPFGQRAKAWVLLMLGLLAFSATPWLGGVVATRFVAGYLIYFAAGAVFGLWAGGGFDIKACVVGALLVVAALVQFVLQGEPVAGGRWLGLIAGLTGLGTVVALSAWLGRFDLPWLASLGRYSLAIYLMHVLASSGVRIVMDKLLDWQHLPVHLVLGFAVGVWLPMALARRFDQVGMDWLFSAPISRWVKDVR